MSGTPEIQARYFKLIVMNLHNGKPNDNAGVGCFQPFVKNFVTSATGNFTSTNVTAPSQA